MVAWHVPLGRHDPYFLRLNCFEAQNEYSTRYTFDIRGCTLMEENKKYTYKSNASDLLYIIFYNVFMTCYIYGIYK